METSLGRLPMSPRETFLYCYSRSRDPALNPGGRYVRPATGGLTHFFTGYVPCGEIRRRRWPGERTPDGSDLIGARLHRLVAVASPARAWSHLDRDLTTKGSHVQHHTRFFGRDSRRRRHP